MLKDLTFKCRLDKLLKLNFQAVSPTCFSTQTLYLRMGFDYLNLKFGEKMKNTIVLTILLGSFFVGCTAKMEKLPGSLESSRYAPTNSSQQYGLISYDSEDGDMAREDAYKQMYSACNGS